jgi:XRE family transcriptional regulator, regulator of sulfur utilization
MTEDSDLAARLGRNIKQLRESRAMTQQQMAKLAELPRATWANLESGSANPTLHVLHRVALALQVPFEELIAAPRSSAKLYPRGTLPIKNRGNVEICSLLPDNIPGMTIERLRLAPLSRMIGIPHTPGTREYLTCELGKLTLVASGQSFTLETGDVVVFRGDQRHSYHNPEKQPAIGYSVVVLQPTL